MPFQLSPGVNVTEVDLTTIVPAVATSTGAIAGIFNWGPVNERTLVDSETSLVNIFGKPNANNAETWFTAANFLGYTNSLIVARAANTFANSTYANGQISAYNAYGTIAGSQLANSSTVAILNTTDYSNKAGTFDSSVIFAARYPGALGNSLKVSVCDSPNAYSSTLNMVANADVTASFTANIGSNSVTVVVSSVSANGIATNAYASALAANLTVGDTIGLGNSSIGIQFDRLNTIGALTAVSNVASFTLTFDDTYRGATQFIANSTASNTVTRHWEFYNVVDQAPTTSTYVSQFGNSAAVDTMHVVVADENGMFTGTPGAILETFTNVSRATDAKTIGGQTNYYRTIINQTSNYIWDINDRTGAASANAALIASSTNGAALTLSLNYGSDGITEANTSSLQILANAYNLFASPEDVDISLVLQGKPIGGSTASGSYTVNNFQLANYIIDNICATRLDCVAFITPDDGVVTGNAGNEALAITAWRNVIHDSSYAVMDSGYKYMYDRYNDIYRYVPTNGDIAGLCARTDATRDPWWSPAGLNRGQIKNVVKMRYNPRKSARDILYKNGINPVVSFPGEGTVLYGDKTLQSKPSAFDRINVRRLFIVLEKAISTASKFTLFEFNDEFTRAQFKNLITPYLRDVQGRRGITDFLVVCDGTNNTPQVIDSNQFVGDIYIKPARSINFIQLNFVAVATGVQFSEVVGKF